jgi:hypothetical protein
MHVVNLGVLTSSRALRFCARRFHAKAQSKSIPFRNDTKTIGTPLMPAFLDFFRK